MPPAESAAAAPGSLSDAQIVEALRARQGRPPGGMRKGLLILIGFALFAAVGLIPASLDYFCLLAVAVLIHDLGHLSAMKRFGCQETELFVLRFFIKPVRSLPGVQSPAVRAQMALAGAVAGAMGIYTALLLVTWVDFAYILWFVWASCLFNVYNLLPLRPLDGGWLLQSTILGRHPTVDLCGKYLIVALLIYASMSSGYWFVALIAAFLFISTIFSHPVAKIAYKLRQDPAFAGAELTEEKVARIREEIRAINPSLEPSSKNPSALPNFIWNIWESANRTYAPAKIAAGTLAAYVVLLLLFAYAYYRVVLGA